MSRNGSSWSSPLMLPQKGLLWATFPFFFSLMCSEKKNRRTAVFRAERSAEETAVSAKDSAASDAEPFAVAGAVSHNRQLPRPKRPGWRSIFFFSIQGKEVQTAACLSFTHTIKLHIRQQSTCFPVPARRRSSTPPARESLLLLSGCVRSGPMRESCGCRPANISGARS